MPNNTKILALLFAVSLAPLGAQTPTSGDLLTRAESQVVDYLAKLSDLHCTEQVRQQKLEKNGHVEAAAHSKFDYFILIQGDANDFQIAESRLEQSSDKRKNAALLLTNGFSSLVLVFHPYYRNSFNFTLDAAVVENGRAVVPVHFAHIPGTRSPAGLALRSREYALDLNGVAYLDQQTARVVRMESSLVHSMDDIGVKSLAIAVNYKPFVQKDEQLMLPDKVFVELETPKQHWRNEHAFSDYRTFSAEAEQSAEVKIHKDPTKDPNKQPADAVDNPPQHKEPR